MDEIVAVSFGESSNIESDHNMDSYSESESTDEKSAADYDEVDRIILETTTLKIPDTINIHSSTETALRKAKNQSICIDQAGVFSQSGLFEECGVVL